MEIKLENHLDTICFYLCNLSFFVNYFTSDPVSEGFVKEAQCSGGSRVDRDLYCYITNL